jgi:hypothetical protein
VSYRDYFDQLSDWLNEHELLWSSRPFIKLPVEWEYLYPEVATNLKKLSLEDIEKYESFPWKLPNMPQDFRNWARQSLNFDIWPKIESSWQNKCNYQRPKQVSERKWQQIKHFISAIIEHQPSSLESWLDWCSGKGHLGRTLAQVTDKPVKFIEQDQKLCQKGQLLADHAQIEAKFINGNVFDIESRYHLKKNTGIVALHACGQLNMHLLKSAVKQQTSFIAVAPCCYQRIIHDDHQPLSKTAQSKSISFKKHHLKLVSFDEVVADKRHKLLRRREQAWRLAVDSLIRKVNGNNQYRPLGSVPKAWLEKSFTDFCKLIFAREKLSLPTDFAPKELEDYGQERLITVRALGMVRGLFRRPLESWLLLDRILFLEENGYTVTAGTFCNREITPRNLIIVAARDLVP